MNKRRKDILQKALMLTTVLGGKKKHDPNALVFTGTTGNIQIPANAGIANLADGAMTLEMWVWYTTNSVYFNKQTGGYAIGFSFNDSSSRRVAATVFCATTKAVGTSARNSMPAYDSGWHHIAFTWDDAGDRKVRVFSDGALILTTSAGDGAVKDDAARPLDIFKGTAGKVGWIRISNTVRYAVNFTPDGRLTPPAVDANTIVQFNIDEKSGTTLTNAAGNAALNATVTDGTWVYVP